MRALLDPFSLLVVSIAGWMNQHQQHWKLGKFAGIDVYLHATFILLLVWIASMHWMAGHNLETMPAGIAFMLALFGSVLLHEFGHALTAKAFGNRHARYHAAAHRRHLAYREDAGEAQAGIGSRAGWPGRERCYRCSALRLSGCNECMGAAGQTRLDAGLTY
jgi:hypothetical protein